MAIHGELINGANIETHDCFLPLKLPVQVDYITLTEVVTEDTTLGETMTEATAHMETVTEAAANVKTGSATVKTKVNLADHAKVTIISDNRQNFVDDDNTVSSAPV